MGQTLVLSPTALGLNVVIGMGIPALVGLLAKRRAPTWLLAVLNLGFSAATGILTAVTTAPGGHIQWAAVLVSFGETWALSIGTHFGFLKPTGVSDALLGKGGVVGPSGPPSNATTPPPLPEPGADDGTAEGVSDEPAGANLRVQPDEGVEDEAVTVTAPTATKTTARKSTANSRRTRAR